MVTARLAPAQASGDGCDVSIPERVLGWLQRLQPFGVSTLGCITALFQSLKGFWGGYSFWRRGWGDRASLVSIPERVLGWLQPVYSRNVILVSLVSIPERVLGWLQR